MKRKNRSFAQTHHTLELLEERRAPASATTTVFDFEGESGSRLTSYDVTVNGITATITRPGSSFDIEQISGSTFGTGISPFGDTVNRAFIINFSEPVKAVGLHLGDFGQDDNDNLVLQAFAKPDAKGKSVASDHDTLPSKDGDPFDERVLSVSGKSIQSIRVIGGTNAFPNSTYLDQISVSPVGLDLTPAKLKFSTAKGGIDFSYTIAGSNLPEGETAKVGLYWATGPLFEDTTQLITKDFAAHAKKGTYKEHVAGSLLQDAPIGTTHIVMVLDPDDEVNEALEDNNALELLDVRLDIESQVVGALSQHTQTVLKNLLRVAGQDHASVTSNLRSPEEQARIMFDNIISDGVKSQFKLYGPVGDTVVQAFVDAADEHEWNTRALRLAHRDEIEQSMVDVINAVPDQSKVSSHLADPSVLQAIDLAPSSFFSATKHRFIHAALEAKADGILRDFLQPPKDKAFHVEVIQA